ncbi:MAG: GNAT family N-acetyltransferase [Gemmataceae bacterium]|nr:GNAT family N-acetyltransferase [Gemmataceae bacterium]
MKPIEWPSGLVLESLAKRHDRKAFRSGETAVDGWLKTNALQNQQKNLSATKAITADGVRVVGYYTIGMTQVDFGDLPESFVRKLRKRLLPAAVLDWLGVDESWQKKGLGERLLGSALLDCRQGSRVFPFVAVILDAISDASRAFYRHFGFDEMPGHPYRLYLPTSQLEAMVEGG